MSPTGDPSHPSARARRKRPSARQVVAALLAIVIVFFVLQNREYANIQLFFFAARLPLWLALAVTALLGTAVGYLLGRRK